MTTITKEIAHSQDSSYVPLKGFDYIEIYVGNARQAAHFYRTAFGFTPVAYSGLETGARDRTSIVVQQDDIRFVLTSALIPQHQIGDHVMLHGDGVKDIAFTVEDAVNAFETAIEHGAQPVMQPTVVEDSNGAVVKATIAAYGDTVHSFIERGTYVGVFAPGYQVIKNPPHTVPTGLHKIDHVAVNVESSKMSELVDFYNEVLGFHHSYSTDVATEYSSMNSKVVQNSTGNIIFPIVEPAPGKGKSQVEEFLSFHNGPGAQHIALISDDLIQTVRALLDNGNEFLQTPDSYYDVLESRIGPIDEDIEVLRELNILVDRDEWGYLLQIFTKPLHNRPTIFMEIIQRKRARGFGAGNVKALFEALERDQAERGNL
jgi:4-hydroxyphenylpyruvate dioxygenase